MRKWHRSSVAFPAAALAPAALLEAVTLATLRREEGCDLVHRDEDHSAADSTVLRLQP